jgi:response regulator RpfG family c-di-GMP phosphodiesterase
MDQEGRNCGRGLAEHSVLPAKIGEWIGALAEILALHRTALDRSDAKAQEEDRVYESLVRQHREIAARLAAAAAQMAGARDLPTGRHDERALADSRVLETFAWFVGLEQEMLDLLPAAVERDRRRLGEMRGFPSGGL